MREKFTPSTAWVRVVTERRLLMPTLIFVAVFLLYVAFLTHGAHITRDPIDYASAAESTLYSSHSPFHLIYQPVGRLFYLLWGLFGYQGGAMLPMQVLNALAGALGVALFYVVLNKIVEDRFIALATSLMLAFSYSYWRYSVEAMPYVPMVLILVLSFVLMLRIPRINSRREALFLGMANGLAVLFNVGCVLLLPSAGVAIWARRKGVRDFWQCFVLYTLGLFLVGAVPYMIFGVAVLGFRSPQDVLIQYGLGQRYWLSPGGAQFSFIGLGSLFVGESFALRFLSSNPTARARIVSSLPALPLAPPEVSKISILQIIAILGVLVLVALGLLACVLYVARFWKRIWHNQRLLLMICVSWLAPFAIFTVWVSPMKSHHWIANLIPIWTIVALVLKDAKDNMSHRLAAQIKLQGLTLVFLCSLFFVNFFGSILPDHNPKANWNMELALLLSNHVGERDLIMPLEAGDYKHAPPYMLYYVRCQVIPVRYYLFQEELGPYIRGEIEATLSESRHVYVLFDAFDSDQGYRQISRATGLSNEEIRRRIDELFTGYDLQMALQQDDGEPLLYELIPKSGEGL